MIRTLLIGNIFGLAVASSAQTLPGVPSVPGLTGSNWKLGYYFGSSFAGTGETGTVRLQGPEIGVEIPILNLPTGLLSVSLNPSVVFGGGFSHGGDNDGQLYRVLGRAKTGIPMTGLYAFAGLGIEWGAQRGTTTFNTNSGLVKVIGLGKGIPLTGNLGKQSTFEVAYYFGDSRFTGYTVSLGLRF